MPNDPVNPRDYPAKRQRRLHRVESFGPKVMAILMHGAVRQSTFTSEWSKVIQLIQRINQLREAMHRENHPMYPTVAKVQVWIPDYPNPAVPPLSGKHTPVRAVIGTRDAKFDDIIEQLGISTDLNPDGEATSPPTAAGESIEELLSHIPSKGQRK